ncbi:TRAP transporter small permease [Thermodesulfobacteriota bacterium]
MKLLGIVDRAIAKLEGWLVVIFLTLMIALTFFQVILRALYTHAHLQWANTLLGQVDWAEPFVRLLVLWVTFLGASLLTGDNKHIKIDLMSSLLPTKWQPWRDIILSFGSILILGIALKASLNYIHLEMEFAGKLFLNIPTWMGQLILPMGFAVILFRFCLRAIDQAIILSRRTPK